MRKIRINITKKLAITYLIIVFSAIMSTVFYFNVLVRYQELDAEFINENIPCIDKLKEIQDNSIEINKLTKYLVFVSSPEDRVRLNQLINNDYPAHLRTLLAIYTKKATEVERKNIDLIEKSSHILLADIRQILGKLNTQIDYLSNEKINLCAGIYYKNISPFLETNDSKFSELLTQKSFRQKIIFKEKELLISNINYIFSLTLGIIITVSLVSVYYTKKKISKPLISLEKIISNVCIGLVQPIEKRTGKDEIANMQNALSNMIDGLEDKIVFAQKIGSGNYQAEVQLLSEQDQLGYSLINMSMELQKYDKNIRESKALVEAQKNKIMDSINYSLRIQQSIIPSDDVFNNALRDHFVFYRPKDVVSGDFPWLFETEHYVYYGVVDCTGHGVPGAMMSMIGNLLLNAIVQNGHEHKTPSEILTELHHEVVKTLKQKENRNNNSDGMDVSMCRLDFDKNEVVFSGAHLPLYLMRNGELEIYKGNRFPVGGTQYKNKNAYTDHFILLEKGDIIFIFSDGIVDQIGGEFKKKWMTGNFIEFITSNHNASMQNFKKKIITTFDEYKGDCKQVDDVLVIGVHI